MVALANKTARDGELLPIAGPCQRWERCPTERPLVAF